MNDNELHEAFRAIARQDARAASPFSRSRAEAKRPYIRARRHRRLWYTASGLALAAAATLVFAVMPQRTMLDLDLGGPKMVPFDRLFAEHTGQFAVALRAVDWRYNVAAHTGRTPFTW